MMALDIRTNKSKINTVFFIKSFTALVLIVQYGA